MIQEIDSNIRATVNNHKDKQFARDKQNFLEMRPRYVKTCMLLIILIIKPCVLLLIIIKKIA